MSASGSSTIDRPSQAAQDTLEVPERSGTSAGALDLPLAHRLFGRNILLWEFAIAYEPFTQMRDPLRDLAEWVRAYNRSHRPAYLGEWQTSLVGFAGLSEAR